MFLETGCKMLTEITHLITFRKLYAYCKLACMCAFFEHTLIASEMECVILRCVNVVSGFVNKGELPQNSQFFV